MVLSKKHHELPQLTCRSTVASLAAPSAILGRATIAAPAEIMTPSTFASTVHARLRYPHIEKILAHAHTKLLRVAS